MAPKMKRVAESIYKRGNVFYERITFDGKNTYKKLAVATLKEARDYRTARRALHLKALDGLTSASPYDEAPAKSTQAATVADLCQEFLKAGCPDKQRQFKTGHGLDEEKRRVRYLQAWDGWGDAEKISNAVLLRYETYRKGMKGTKLKNGRSIDMEVTTLKNVLRWGVLCERIKAYPFANVEIIKFQKGESAHAKHHCAQSPEELHTLAARLFSFPQSEVLGFQYLFEAFTGLRTSEALACRWNAKYGEPGFIDGDYLHVGRKKDGVNPWVKIHPALRALLDAMKLWRDTRKVIINNKAEFPLSKSQWFFPSPQYPTQAVCRKSLAHALQREVSALIKEKKLPAGYRLRKVQTGALCRTVESEDS